MRNGFIGTIRFGALCALLFLVCFAERASAQKEPDMRAIAPFVMIVADTSGSMEWLPGCECTTASCNCYPDCSLSNGAGNVPPAGKKNRWAMLLEALTGTFSDFECVPLARNDTSQFTYDIGYPKPFHRPWECPLGQTYCGYPGTEAAPIQIQNGLLDNYASRIRFGLATFDGMRTYTGAGDLVTSFNSTLSNGKEGSYSYGGPRTFRYPTCTQEHMIDSGIRSASAPEGGLISLNTPLCATPPCDPSTVNAAIQSSLLNTRTFGGTPTASALDDLYTHFKTELNDSMASCRERYAILITDGYPDDDFRKYPVPGCDCAAEGNCPADDPDPNANHCPYPTAEQVASDLKNGRTTDTSKDDPQLDKLFVVGMSISDNASRIGLNAIASAGGSVDTDMDGNEAFFADDPTTLTATLDQLLGDLTKPISRSVPAFATGASGGQYQVSAGFTISPETVPPGFTPPWKGILERRRFLCNEQGFSTPTLTDDDRFDLILNKREGRSRRLWTSLHPSPTAANAKEHLFRGSSDAPCGLNGCTETALSSVPLAVFGSIDAARQSSLLAWMYGDSGSVREKIKLGDIYHSSPAIVTAPVDDPGDQSYTLFKESKVVAERPAMMYVNSNDGVVHAFVLEDHNVAGKIFTAGHEMWGFIPPNLLGSLDSQMSAHRLNLDATPVVKDVFFSKGSAPSATDYKTVLITGMRGGGNHYMALDVTDPENPKFMWQFYDDQLGMTYGQPVIVQARYQWPAGGAVSTRAMAILPGGKGEKNDSAPDCSATTKSVNSMRQPSTNAEFTSRASLATTAAEIKHRSEVQCWNHKGRSLYFVDVETGKLIKKIYDTDSSPTNGTVFPSPVSGSPTAYQDAVGTVATEGFVIDADGVIWRIDLTQTDPRKDEPLAGWTVRPFHDLFWDLGPADGETSYERPILSLDDQHQLVVIVGTGDTDNFEKATAMNRVVSLTEVTNPGASVPGDYKAALNWELRADEDDDQPGLVRSELITGTMALFAQQLFIASFISVGNSTDPCSAGLGRLWSVHYNKRDETMVNRTKVPINSAPVQTFGPKRIPVVSVDTSGNNADLGLFNIPKAAAEPNLLVLGLGSTQRLTCDATGENLGNYFTGGEKTMPGIKQSSPPSIWIVAQASSDNKGRSRAGSKLGSLEVQLSRPTEFSQVSSWAGSIE